LLKNRKLAWVTAFGLPFYDKFKVRGLRHLHSQSVSRPSR
jgi:hypothetical protein